MGGDAAAKLTLALKLPFAPKLPLATKWLPWGTGAAASAEKVDTCAEVDVDEADMPVDVGEAPSDPIVTSSPSSSSSGEETWPGEEVAGPLDPRLPLLRLLGPGFGALYGHLRIPKRRQTFLMAVGQIPRALDASV
eukprot:CAMPEP_0180236384 /NCGR_PEP_ID=MMETSP0987-20121128/29747_1 /TAXON_ID=697907 /ORGANISM="non described non described, Strain CCMP2293" /LENGTH=135 /DNA_ID=CAMNT_0022202599 /DNA_START=63 /DNA_END=467 /DNA_ORIENTATION=+